MPFATRYGQVIKIPRRNFNPIQESMLSASRTTTSLLMSLLLMGKGRFSVKSFRYVPGPEELRTVIAMLQHRDGPKKRVYVALTLSKRSPSPIG
jgi:hypothetical protein